MISFNKNKTALHAPIMVMHISGNASRSGGAQRSIVSLVRGMDNDRFVSFLGLYKRLPICEELDLRSINVLPRRWSDGLCEPWGRVPFRIMRPKLAQFWLAMQIKRLGVDIVHIHSNSGPGSAVLTALSKFSGVRVVNTLRNDPTRVLDCNRRKRLWLNPYVDRWVVISPDHIAGLESRLGVTRSKIISIPNGIDLGYYSAPKSPREITRASLELENRFVCLSVGRIEEGAKDYVTLFRAFQIVKQTRPEAIMIVAGEGPDVAKMLSIIRDLNLQHAIRFLGHRDDVPDIMAAADVLVFSTYSEGFGRVAAEAMAVGLPVVATNVPGLRYVCNNGNAGLLVEPENPECLAKMIIELIRNQNIRELITRRAKEWVFKEFSDVTMIQRHEDMYRSIMIGAR